MERLNRRFVLARRPQGLPAASDFRMETVPVPDPGPGEVLVRNAFVSVDPGMRARLGEATSYAAPLGLGETVEGATVGHVVASRNERFHEGDVVATGFGWQEWGLSDGRGLRKVEPRLPPTASIGVLGVPGLTAWVAMMELAPPEPGQTVLISSAAGPVGATAGQIARDVGARVVGIAGGHAKCVWLREELKFETVIDRHQTPDLEGSIAAAAPKGVHVYLDNVGGHTLDAAIANMALGGRIVVSGQVADYNAPTEAREGVRNLSLFITRRLSMRGFVVYDHAKSFRAAWTDLEDRVFHGRLKWREEIIEGIENLPDAFIGLFRGENFGRRLVKVGDALKR
jgi:NADPH-dependent curcumin reductase CurA